MNNIRIDVQPTPNPNALKFTLDRPTTEGAPISLRGPHDTSTHPALARIMAVEGVTGVFATGHFISVNKAEDSEWDALVPDIVQAIQQGFGGSSAS